MNTEFPFSVAKNNDELEEHIKTFNEVEYNNKLQLFYRDMELVFEGNASKRVVDRIYSKRIK